MPIATQKYIRKPLYVDAVRITDDNFDEIVSWCQGEVQQDEVPHEGNPDGKQYIKVRVHNPKNPRQTKAFVGDWLLYTERGYKVYTTKAFHASFDLVENNTGQDVAGKPEVPQHDVGPVTHAPGDAGSKEETPEDTVGEDAEGDGISSAPTQEELDAAAQE